MKKSMFTLLGILGLCTAMLAQNKATITGLVIDAQTLEPLFGASVKVGDGGTTADFVEGKYTIEVDPGTHTVEYSFIGYEPVLKEVTVEAGQKLDLNITLGETSTMLNTATISTSKFEKSLGEVTVSLDIIKPDLLENTNASAVNEALEKVPGVNTMGDQVSIRGGAGFGRGTGSRVLVLMDDMPMMQADAGIVNWRDLPTENVAQMEVLKGAASALYGSSAMNGVINIRTAYPTAKPVTKASIFGTLYGDPKDKKDKWWTTKNMPYQTGLQLAHRQKFGKFDLVAGANAYMNQSFRRSYRMAGSELDTTPGYDHKLRVSANMRYRVSENLIVGLNTNLNFGRQNMMLFWRGANQKLQGTKGDTTKSLYESPDEPAPRGTNARITVDPSVTYYDKFGNRHRAQFRYYYIDNNNDADKSNSSNMFYGEYQYQRKFEKLKDLEVSAGFVGSTITSVADVYANSKYTHTNFAGYIQLDKKFFDRLNVSVGMRYEMNIGKYPDSVSFQVPIFGEIKQDISNIQEGRPVFRAGLNYRIGSGTFLRASWGQGYRFPTILEKFITTNAGGVNILPNIELNSESGWSAEVGVKQGFKLSDWKGFVDIAGFWTEYDNMMEFQQNLDYLFSYNVINVGSTRINGIDCSVAGEGSLFGLHATILMGYTFLNPRFKEWDTNILNEDGTGMNPRDYTVAQQNFANTSNQEENILKYRSQHTFKFDGQVTYKGISLGTTLLYQSQIKAIDEYLYTNYYSIQKFRKEHSNGYFLFNARLAYQINKHAKVSVLAQNLLNMQYVTQPAMLEAPRNFTLRADFTF
ncbi:MAG: TonB-dependent receptor [Aureispira sp.]|nr:TonB-dependent receptor [Aureispira sp.]